MIPARVSAIFNSITIKGDKKENLPASGRSNNSIEEQQILPISFLKNPS